MKKALVTFDCRNYHNRKNVKNHRDLARRLNCATGRTRFIDKAMQRREIGEGSRDCEARITRAYYDTLAVRVPYYLFLYFYHFISLECSSNDVRVEMGKRNRKRTVIRKAEDEWEEVRRTEKKE